MSFFSDLLPALFERRYRAATEDDSRSTQELCHDLLSASGEVSGIAMARTILDRYRAMTDEEKSEFFVFLATQLDIDLAALRSALGAYETSPDKATYRTLMAVGEAKRQELARRLNQVPGATHQLVQMRADLLRLDKTQPDWGAVDLDFRHLFNSWFNRGFLVLRPISWDSPATILEKIIAYEAVHSIDSWEDLRLRLQPADRRCFAFFHPAMADEPLIFVEVALTKGVPNSVQALLTQERSQIEAEDVDTAVFYSISNCQAGLAGISFGNSLIKQVVADLSRELSGLTTFVTLSPIPKLSSWSNITGPEISALPEEEQKQRAAHYLMTAKHKTGAPYDPVARFHLGNGARIHAVHAGADLSDNGIAQSGGVMVNYLYDLNQISQNHEKFAAGHEIAVSAQVRALSTAAEKNDIIEKDKADA